MQGDVDVGLDNDFDFDECETGLDTNFELNSGKQNMKPVDREIKQGVELEIDNDSSGTDENDDELFKARKDLLEEKKRIHNYEEEAIMIKKLATSKFGADMNLGSDFKDNDSDVESPYELFDDDECGFLSAPVSHKKVKNPKMSYVEGNRVRETVFYMGQQFENANQFRKAIIDYCVHHGRDTPFNRNEKDRIGAHCFFKDQSCPWKIWASWENGKRSFTVKTHVGEHTCGRIVRWKKNKCYLDCKELSRKV